MDMLNVLKSDLSFFLYFLLQSIKDQFRFGVGSH